MLFWLFQQALRRLSGRFSQICRVEPPVVSNHNAGQSLSNKHPAEVVVLDFYKGHYGGTGRRDYYAFLAQNRDKFTPEFYRNLVRGLRIDSYSRKPGMFNFDIFSGVQSSVFSFQVGSFTTNGNEAIVPITVMAGLSYQRQQPVLMRARVLKNENKWQIADILYPRQEKSLMDSLRKINSNRDFQNVPWEK
jgi:hypothetical protein